MLPLVIFYMALLIHSTYNRLAGAMTTSGLCQILTSLLKSRQISSSTACAFCCSMGSTWQRETALLSTPHCIYPVHGTLSSELVYSLN